MMTPSKTILAVIAALLLFLLLFSVAYLFYSQQQTSERELYLTQKRVQESHRFDLLKNTYEAIVQNTYDNIIATDKITSLVRTADTTYDPVLLVSLRKELYDELLPLYENLKDQHIPELNFYLQGSISFLRFDAPKRFGDSLTGTRSGIDKVNRTRQAVHGFETGTTFNGYKHIYPLLHNNKYTGAVELSYSLKALTYEAMKNSAGYSSLILKKSLIDAGLLNSENSVYTPTTLSSDYLQEIQVLDKTAVRSYNAELIGSINQNLAGQASVNLEKGSAFVLDTKAGKSHFLVSFVPIYTMENKLAAYFVTYQKELLLPQIEETYQMNLLVSALGALLLCVLLILYLISRQKAAKHLEMFATADPLTKISNRNKFNLVLYSAIQMALRYELPLSVLVFNIDHFKKINDQLGTETGDEILIEISSLVLRNIRQADLMARWGGDEFIILLPETTHHNAHILAQKLKKLINEHTFVVTTSLTCSFGLTQLHKNDDETTLLKRLNSALQSAKEQGRNKIAELS